jgi:hypothetical protein
MKITEPDIYAIPQDGYVAFDALSLRQLIVNRLNEQKVFTDQNFIGSNLATVIDIISYSYHTLIYYLNKTSTESMFTEAQLYENMNRIVKLLDYNPVGYQTSTLSFNASASNLAPGIYAIPRYTTVNLNGIPFAFNEDVSFVKTTPNITESLTEMSRLKLLFQGQFQEHPKYTATGEGRELLIINTAESLVDHYNIHVYVKEADINKWITYKSTPSLYLENGIAKKYEIRLNSNKRYEIRFGDDINGRKLQTGDVVAVYYLESSGENGVVGQDFFTKEVRKYNTPQYNEILNDVNNEQLLYLEATELTNLFFKNNASSTTPKNAETTEEIRQLAPAVYRSQYRLVTAGDYEAYIKANFANFIIDVKVVNNWDYTSSYLKYFYELGVTNPKLTSRALFNQILYADSCNFNNGYIVIVPRTATGETYNFLTPAQKELISSSILSTKMNTTETTFLDPVYKAFSFGIGEPDEVIDIIDNEFFYLVLQKASLSRVSNEAMINDAVTIITNYFNPYNNSLGKIIDPRALTQQLYDINGVEEVRTVRDDTGSYVEGVSLVTWNQEYPDNDVIVSQNSFTLRFFEFPFFYNSSNIRNLIKVQTRYGVYESVEY